MGKILVGYFAVLFLSFSKGNEPENKSPWKNLLAFFLAGFAMMVLFNGMTIFLNISLGRQVPVQVEIRSNVDIRDIVAAIHSVNRKDLAIRTEKRPSVNGMEQLAGGAIGFMFVTGLMLFFYKRVCSWMKIPPDI